jgi:hypothetical protein
LPSRPLRLERTVQLFFPNILQTNILQKRIRKKSRARSPALKKKSRARSPALKIVSTLNFPENLDLILMDGATLLVRARAPPETWTTRLKPCGESELALLDHLFRLVIIFSNDCSKFEQPTK